jgi:hypothetical protein
MRGVAEEESDLATAERHIIWSEMAISVQRWRIENVKNSALNIDDAQSLLTIMESLLETFQQHRQLILEALTRIDHRI